MPSFKLAIIMALSIVQLTKAAVAPRSPAFPTIAIPNYASLPNGASQVIPGPGMPSLESLGLTNEMLFDPEFQAKFTAELNANSALVKARSILDKRWTNQCSDTDRGNDGGVIACAVFLQNLGHQQCGVDSDGTIMCQAEVDGIWTYIGGFAYTVSTASSWCQDVALGAWWSRDNCKGGCIGNDCAVGAFAAANGNGNLIVDTFGTLL